MKISDIVNGYIKKEKKYIPFEFDKSNFQLKLFSDYKQWKKNSNPSVILDRFFKYYNSQETQELEIIDFKGITSDNYNVVFYAADKPYIKNGFITYSCVYVYISNSKIRKRNIYGIRFKGGVIESFFPSKIVFKKELKFSESIKGGVEAFNIEAGSSENINCGNYLDIGNLSVQSYASLRGNSNEPLYSSSVLSLILKKPLTIVEAEKHCLDMYHMFQILSYRKNIDFDDCEIVTKNHKGQLIVTGIIGMHLKKFEKEAYKNSRYILNHECLGSNLGKLLEIYKIEEIVNAYLPESYKDRYMYDSPRIYMILADFEKQFRMLYTDVTNKSSTIKATKKEVIAVLEELEKEKKNSSIRDDYTRIINHVSQMGNDVSYKKKLEIAFDREKDIIEPFIRKHYKGEYDDCVKGIINRMSTIRNEISHGSLNVDIQQKELKDIQMIERLNYMLLLKRAKIDLKNIVKCISTLFNDLL